MPTEKIIKNLNFEQKRLVPKMDWILLDTDPLLHEKCEEVHEITETDNELINRMISYIDTCYEDNYKDYNIRPGIAIAGPQVGLKKRIIYLHLNDDDQEHRYLLINPEIVARSQAHSYIPGGEGCLSVPKDVKANIKRNFRIIVKAYDLLTKKEVEINATNVLSICLQHEIDHLDGILYTDRIDKEHPNYHAKDWIKID